MATTPPSSPSKKKRDQFPVLTKFEQEGKIARLKAQELEEKRELVRSARNRADQFLRLSQQVKEEKEERPSEIDPAGVRQIFSDEEQPEQRDNRPSASNPIRDAAAKAARDQAQKVVGNAAKQVGRRALQAVSRQAIAAAAKALLANPYFWAVVAVIGIAVLIIALIFAVSLGATSANPATTGTSMQQPINPGSAVLEGVLAGSSSSSISSTRKFLAEIGKLKERLADNGDATAILGRMETAAQAIISNPKDKAQVAEQKAIIRTEATAFVKLNILSPGERIAIVALSRVGDPTSAYYAPNPRLACASFVGKVIREAGAVPNTCSAAAHTLSKQIEDAGAVRILPPAGESVSGTPGVELSQDNLNQLKPGDLIFFRTSSSGTYGHTGIYIANGEMADTSSGEQVVKRRSVSQLVGPGRNYQLISAYRFEK